MPNPVLTDAIDRLAAREDLTTDRMAAVLAEIMGGNASEVETAAVLIALRTKGETVDELVGLAGDDAPLRRAGRYAGHARRPDRHRGHRRRPPDVQRLDHRRADRGGRRAAPSPSTATARPPGCRARPTCWRRSACGSTSSPAAVARCIEEVGFGFMFAPAHHGATRFVVPVRKELAVRTIFNFLGPLTNPAGATRQVIGVSDPAFLEVIAGALARLGAPQGARRLERRRPGRAEHRGRDARRRGRRRRRCAATRSRPRTSGCARSVYEDVAGGPPDANARDDAAHLRRRARSAARPRGAQRGRGDLRRRAASDGLERGRPRRRGARSTAAPPRRRSTGSSSSRVSWRRLERAGPHRGGDARRGRAPPRASCRSPQLEAALRERPESRPFQEALTRPGISVIAEHKRRSPSAGRDPRGRCRSRTSCAPTSAAARPRSRC